MESWPNKEASNLPTTGELVIQPATRVSSPTLALRRPNDESRPEISIRTLRSHSRGGRSSVCVQELPNQAGSFPLCRESLTDRATRPNNPNSEPEMLPDRPFSTMVGRDLSPPPGEMGNSERLASVVPTDISDETSASFHSTPDFHNAPQTPSSHIYLEVPTTCISSDFYTASHTAPLKKPKFPAGPGLDLYTGPTPVITTPTAGLDFYIASHTAPLKKPKFPADPGPHFYTCFKFTHFRVLKRQKNVHRFLEK